MHMLHIGDWNEVPHTKISLSGICDRCCGGLDWISGVLHQICPTSQGHQVQSQGEGGTGVEKVCGLPYIMPHTPDNLCHLM